MAGPLGDADFTVPALGNPVVLVRVIVPCGNVTEPFVVVATPCDDEAMLMMLMPLAA